MIDWPKLLKSLESDGEFGVAARLWDGTVRLDLGAESTLLTIEQGRVRGAETVAADASCDVFLTAPRDVWERMLEPVPAPFFHDLIGALQHHGLLLDLESLDLAAYYPALRRLVELMRENHNAQKEAA